MNTKTYPNNVHIIQCYCYATLLRYICYTTIVLVFVQPHEYNNPMTIRYAPEFTVLTSECTCITFTSYTRGVRLSLL